MTKLPILQRNDLIDLVAPASRCSDRQLEALKDMLCSWGFRVRIHPAIFGDDLLCANHDIERFQQLRDALYAADSKAIICVRGGYGAMRIIPYLEQIPAPEKPKLFVGMSDITCLHLYMQQAWQWSTLHSGVAPDKFSPESLAQLRKILLGELNFLSYPLIPMNNLAKKAAALQGKIVGGNLTLVQASIGTSWALHGRGQFIFLEEVSERGYRLDRMLEHLRQAGLFSGAQAIILGDFTGGLEPDGSSLVDEVLLRFAHNIPIPVLRLRGVGHDYISHPLPLNMRTQLNLGEGSAIKIELAN